MVQMVLVVVLQVALVVVAQVVVSQTLCYGTPSSALLVRSYPPPRQPYYTACLEIRECCSIVDFKLLDANESVTVIYP